MSSGGVVVKLLACGARGRGSIPCLAATISKIAIGYLLLQNRDVAEISPKTDFNPQNNHLTKQRRHTGGGGGVGGGVKC